MKVIVYIYLATSLCSVATALPQVRQILVMKNSDEFNLLSWLAWSIAQITALVYSITIHSLPYVVVNLGWITFYLVMTVLIVKYRHPKVSELASESITIDKPLS